MTILNKPSRIWTSDDNKRQMQVSDDARIQQSGGMQVDMIL